MIFTLNRRTVGSMMRRVVATRIFVAVAVDGWALMNAGWIAVIVALLINLPLALLIGWMTKLDQVAAPAAMLDQACGQWVRRAYCLLLCGFCVFEAATSSRLIALCADYAAFDKLPIVVLISVSILVGAVACLTGGMGVGGASQLWRWIFFVMFVFVFIQQADHMHVRWLTPILGPGANVIMRNVLPLAGIQTTFVASWLCMTEETGQSQRGGVSYKKTGAFFMFASVLFSMLVVLFMLFVRGVLVPPLPGSPNERSFALDVFLANGLNSVALQFPLMMMWFMSHILMLSFYMYTACCMLSQCFPKLKTWVCVAVVGVLSMGVSLSHLSDRNYIDPTNSIRFFAVTVPMVIFAIIYIVKQRGKRVVQS